MKANTKDPAQQKPVRARAAFSQDPHAVREPKDNNLEMSIGHEVRTYRKKLGITVPLFHYSGLPVRPTVGVTPTGDAPTLCFVGTWN